MALVLKYVVNRVGTSASATRTKDNAVDHAMKLSRESGGPFRMKLAKADRWGPKRTAPELRSRLGPRIGSLKANEVLWIDNQKAWPRTVRIRPVIVSYDPLDLPNATENCEEVIAFLRKRFPNHLNLGWFNCRRIAGSSSWSQHAFGNAYDAGGPLTLVKAMGAACIAEAKAGRLPAVEVICNRQKWTPQDGIEPYRGVDPHTGHIHVTAAPYLTGIPPCAR